jgi:outer membrane protein assembly factor BamB
MTAEIIKDDPALVTLDRHDLHSLLDLGPVQDPRECGVELDIRLARIVKNNSAFSNHSFIKDLSAHEDELYAWLAKAPENGKAFIVDPLAAFKAATSASSELLHRIATMEKGDPGHEDLQIAPTTPPRPPLDRWAQTLGTDPDVMCVVDAGDVLYAGGNGMVYKLNAADGHRMDGRRLSKAFAGLEEIGDTEVRLAISAKRDRLFIGSNGFAACLRTSDFALRWHHKFKHRCVVNLLLDGRNLYAGTYGNVFKLDYDSGDTLLTNELKHRGDHEVRLALADDKSLLFVGTDGYALALNTSGLQDEAVWQTSLPDTHKDPITILTRATEVYAAGRGRLFKLTAAGKIVASNPLTGHGDDEVRMQFSGNGKGDTLLLGTHGYALAVHTATLDYRWQTDLAAKQGGAVSVLARGDALYAANRGRVCRLAVSSGNITSEEGLARGPAGGQETGMALSKNGSHLFLGYNGAVNQVPTAGNLVAGWQAIIATRIGCVNDTLAGLFESGVIPETIASEFTFAHSTYAARMTLVAAPKIVAGDGDTNHLTLQAMLLGEISPAPVAPGAGAGASAGELGPRQIVGGYVELGVDLAKLQASVEQENRDDFLLSFNLEPDALFSSANLSHLDVDPPLGLLAPLLALGLLAVMNGAVRRMQFPLKFRIHKPLPSSFNGLEVRVAYTQAHDEALHNRDFLSVLFGRAGNLGSFRLAPSIISNQADANIAFVFSNRFVMETIMAGAGSLKRGDEFGLELNNQYPAGMANTKQVKIDVPYVWLRVDQKYVQSVVHKGALDFDVSLSYRNWATVMIWHAIHGRTATTFSCENGNIRTSVKGELDVPWTAFLNVFGFVVPLLTPTLQVLFSWLVDSRGNLTIAVPGLDVSSISTPSYMQISGRVNRDKSKGGGAGPA